MVFRVCNSCTYVSAHIFTLFTLSDGFSVLTPSKHSDFRVMASIYIGSVWLFDCPLLFATTLVMLKCVCAYVSVRAANTRSACCLCACVIYLIKFKQKNKMNDNKLCRCDGDSDSNNNSNRDYSIHVIRWTECMCMREPNFTTNTKALWN